MRPHRGFLIFCRLPFSVLAPVDLRRDNSRARGFTVLEPCYFGVCVIFKPCTLGFYGLSRRSPAGFRRLSAPPEPSGNLRGRLRRPCRYNVIFSCPPINGLKTSGTVTEPSAFWNCSIIAGNTREVASPEPLSVCTNCVLPFASRYLVLFLLA